MLKCFWGDLSVCRNDELSRTFLRCLAPRDRLRFLGMVGSCMEGRRIRGGLNVHVNSVAQAASRVATFSWP